MSNIFNKKNQIENTTYDVFMFLGTLTKNMMEKTILEKIQHQIKIPQKRTGPKQGIS